MSLLELPHRLGSVPRAVFLALVCLLGWLGLAEPASALTRLPATTYSSNASWTLANSPYVLDGDVTVVAGATLTVEPGVVVKFNGQYRSLTVSGTLVAEGSAASRITFTSLQDDSVAGDSGGDGPTVGARGQWYQVGLQSNVSLSRLRYVDVRYGGSAGGMVRVNRGCGAVSIEDSTISSSLYEGLRLGSTNGCVPAATVRRTELFSNAREGIYVIDGWLTLEDDSLVRDNTGAGVYFGVSSGYAGATSTFTDSDIRNNGGAGVYFLIADGQPTSRFPRARGNNIYANAGMQLTSFSSARRDIDWVNNYFGNTVTGFFNPTVCNSGDRGRLVFAESTADPPAGPISSGRYYVGSGNNITWCHYDRFLIEPWEFSRTYVDDPGGITQPWTWDGCGGGLHAPNPTGCQSDPVNSATGSFTHEVSDLELPGTGVPFTFTRHYNSQDGQDGPLGPGWAHSYSAKLTLAATGDAVFRSETGQQIDFVKQADGSLIGAPGVGSALLRLGDGSYELLRHDQVRYVFDSSGRLTSVRDRNGQGVTLAYGGDGRLATVTDAAGRVATFTHDGTGKLTRVALADGRDVLYGYANGRLTSVTDVRDAVWSYTYESRGWLEKEIDPLQHTLFRNVYNQYGRVIEQYDALDRKTTFAWDYSSQTATATDARGNAWKDVYDGLRLSKRVDPLGNTREYGYDASFNLSSVKDARGNTTTMSYDGRGNLLTRTAPAPLSYVETFSYDALNNLLTARDGRGNTTSYGYDAAGNLTRITEPESIVTELGRAANGLVTSITDPRGKISRFEYDTQGNLTAATRPSSGKHTLTYDASGRVTSTVEPRGNAPGAYPDDYRTSYTYDAADQLLSVTDPLGNRTSFAYHAAGKLTSRTDARNRTTSYGYDAADRLTAVTAPDTTRTTYAYDAIGNLTSRTDANNHATSWAYDPANRLTSSLNVLNQRWTYEYDPSGNQTKLVDANGNATAEPGDGTSTYTYDAIGRLTTIDYADATPDVSFAYDGNSNRTSMTDGSGTVSYSYDPRDRLTGVSRGADTFSYDHDAAGNITRREYPGGREATYAHSDDGQLASVTSNGQTTSYTYDVAGNPIRTDLPSANGYAETRTYDRAGRLTEIRNAKAGQTLSFASYIYDTVGNPTSATTTTGTTSYAYDALDRLTEACFTTGCADHVRYTYDPVGNRLTEAKPAGTTTYSYDSADRLTQTSGPGGTLAYGFDANGNQTQAGTRTFAYDLANRLTSTIQAASTTTYAYDGDGTRLQAIEGTATTSFLWDVNFALPQLALERDGTGATLRNYLHGAELVSVDAGGQSSYFHRDALGSIVTTTSAAGATQWTYTYEPFGLAKTVTQNDTLAPANAIRFAGEQLDPSGHYHLRARQYDPSTARFTATDPLPPSVMAAYPSTYVYANNRPTVLIDPSGMGAVWATKGPEYYAQYNRPLEEDDQFWMVVTGPWGIVRGLGVKLVGRAAAKGGEGFTTFVRDGAGRVKKYTTYGRSHPRDPVPFRPVKRFDRDGKPHFNKATGEYVPTPHVHDPTAPGGVRPPRADEIPR